MTNLAAVEGIAMQVFTEDVEPVVWATAVKLDPRAFPQGRDAVIRQLQDAQIETRNGFYAASLLPHLYRTEPLPVCEALSRNIISLPMYCTLEESDVEFICARLKALRK
jgi:perosamine synthetase